MAKYTFCVDGRPALEKQRLHRIHHRLDFAVVQVFKQYVVRQDISKPILNESRFLHNRRRPRLRLGHGVVYFGADGRAPHAFLTSPPLFYNAFVFNWLVVVALVFPTTGFVGIFLRFIVIIGRRTSAKRK